MSQMQKQVNLLLGNSRPKSTKNQKRVCIDLQHQTESSELCATNFDKAIKYDQIAPEMPTDRNDQNEMPNDKYNHVGLWLYKSKSQNNSPRETYDEYIEPCIDIIDSYRK